jgi:hypothetical protein
MIKKIAICDQWMHSWPAIVELELEHVSNEWKEVRFHLNFHFNSKQLLFVDQKLWLYYNVEVPMANNKYSWDFCQQNCCFVLRVCKHRPTQKSYSRCVANWTRACCKLESVSSRYCIGGAGPEFGFQKKFKKSHIFTIKCSKIDA